MFSCILQYVIQIMHFHIRINKYGMNYIFGLLNLLAYLQIFAKINLNASSSGALPICQWKLFVGSPCNFHLVLFMIHKMFSLYGLFQSLASELDLI